MWTITNQTPFAAERGWVRERDGSESWIVAVKGTFSYDEKGKVRLCDEQPDVLQVPEYRGDPVKSSMLYDGDLVRLKQTTDVILHGYACAPEGEKVESLDVSMQVADVSKTVRVFGKRVYEESLSGIRPSSPEEFERMSLYYERAFGGADKEGKQWDERNPVGRGFASNAEELVGRSVPNVENPSDLITKWSSRPTPAGFGPIPGHWKPRSKFGGTYDEKWEEEQQPLLPHDFDDRFYQCAPEDQQTKQFLKGGEPVHLKNVSAKGDIRFRLPRIRLGFTSIFSRGEDRYHRGDLHTVILEPEEERFSLVWHTKLSCHFDGVDLRTTVIELKKIVGRRPESWEADKR